MDFVHDGTAGGRVFRTLNVIDRVTREFLVIEVDTSITASASWRYWRLSTTGPSSPAPLSNVVRAPSKREKSSPALGKSSGIGQLRTVRCVTLWPLQEVRSLSGSSLIATSWQSPAGRAGGMMKRIAWSMTSMCLCLIAAGCPGPGPMQGPDAGPGCSAPTGGPTLHTTDLHASETWSAAASPHVVTLPIQVLAARR